jgi:serine/threonine-protein kinase RsbW
VRGRPCAIGLTQIGYSEAEAEGAETAKRGRPPRALVARKQDAIVSSSSTRATHDCARQQLPADVSEGFPTIRLELDSRPECLALVRSMLAGVAEPLEFDPELLVDLKTAVSEACSNVVLHAYRDAPGPLAVQLDVVGADVEVTVRDRGSGIRHVASSSEDRMGVGLAVISALADRAEFLSGPEGGTEVRMSFTDRGAGARPLNGPAAAPLLEPPPQLAGDLVATLTPVALLGAVLGRVTRALAAGARFSLDRFSDVYLVTDALAAHANSATIAHQISFTVVVASRRLEIVLGPLRDGSGEQLRSQRSDSPLTLLTDGLSVERTSGSEMLRVVMIDHRGGSTNAAPARS